MNVRGFPVGPLQANCYILDDGDRAVVIDPGGEADVILSFLARHGLQTHEIWLTHAHFDHVGGLAPLLASLEDDVAVRMHPDEAPVLEGAAAHAAAFGIEIPDPPRDWLDLHHGMALSFGHATVRALHTPGHAPGHIAFWLPSEGVVLAGDALFRGSVGRTDLPYGDHDRLISSIREHLLTLPPDTEVLPGHGEATTVGREAATNPFLA